MKIRGWLVLVTGSFTLTLDIRTFPSVSPVLGVPMYTIIVASKARAALAGLGLQSRIFSPFR